MTKDWQWQVSSKFRKKLKVNEILSASWEQTSGAYDYKHSNGFQEFENELGLETCAITEQHMINDKLLNWPLGLFTNYADTFSNLDPSAHPPKWTRLLGIPLSRTLDVNKPQTPLAPIHPKCLHSLWTSPLQVYLNFMQCKWNNYWISILDCDGQT